MRPGERRATRLMVFIAARNFLIDKSHSLLLTLDRFHSHHHLVIWSEESGLGLKWIRVRKVRQHTSRESLWCVIWLIDFSFSSSSLLLFCAFEIQRESTTQVAARSDGRQKSRQINTQKSEQRDLKLICCVWQFHSILSLLFLAELCKWFLIDGSNWVMPTALTTHESVLLAHTRESLDPLWLGHTSQRV